MKFIVKWLSDDEGLLCIEADSAATVRTSLRNSAKQAMVAELTRFDFHGKSLSCRDFFDFVHPSRLGYMARICEAKGLPMPRTVHIGGHSYKYRQLAVTEFTQWFEQNQLTVPPCPVQGGDDTSDAVIEELHHMSVESEAAPGLNLEALPGMDAGIVEFLERSGWGGERAPS